MSFPAYSLKRIHYKKQERDVAKSTLVGEAMSRQKGQPHLSPTMLLMPVRLGETRLAGCSVHAQKNLQQAVVLITTPASSIGGAHMRTYS